jgi:TetR/AcrR family transcriptional repressor of nem operon
MRSGRPKEFDEREVLERAMQLFWLRGYQGAGLADLTAHMGISRQSLYDTFGNKRALFIRVIEHYRSVQLARALALLEREGSPLANVRAVARFFEQLAGDPDGRGCLVANALVELGPHDPEIAVLLEETLEMLRRGLQRALQQARRRGELPAGKSPSAIAQALTSSLVGMSVLGRLRTEPARLRRVLRGTLCLLD